MKNTRRPQILQRQRELQRRTHSHIFVPVNKETHQNENRKQEQLRTYPGLLGVEVAKG